MATHLEYLQAVFKKFDPITAPNEEILIRYFCKKLCLSIQAKLDYQKHDLDLWKKVIKKAVDTKIKANLQPPFKIREIDSKYSKGYKLSAKKKKTKLVGSTKMGTKTKTKLSSIISYLLI